LHNKILKLIRNYFLFILFSLILSSLDAQVKTGVKITGKVVDANAQKPIEYATITILDGSKKAITGSVTDNKGNFVIQNLSKGSYSIKIEFIGFKVYQNDSLRVTDPSKPINLNTIGLQSQQETLAQVTVVSRAPIIENKIDKIIYNAANDVTSQGGVELDVLKKVTQVTVDIDGNVELQGNSSIRFLINGKPSSIFGSNLADALASIPAS